MCSMDWQEPGSSCKLFNNMCTLRAGNQDKLSDQPVRWPRAESKRAVQKRRVWACLHHVSSLLGPGLSYCSSHQIGHHLARSHKGKDDLHPAQSHGQLLAGMIAHGHP